MLTIAILLAFHALVIIIYALALYAGARLAKSPKASLSRAFAISFFANLLAIALQCAWLFLALNHPLLKIAVALFFFALVCTAVWLLSFRLFKLTLLKSLLPLLFFFLGDILSILLVLFLLHPFIMDAFVIPTNSMAPTILAEHTTATCPLCGGDLIGPSPKNSPNRYGPTPPNEPVTAICSHCLKISTLPFKSFSAAILPSDRVLALKFLTPNRWDLIAYKDPTTGDIFLKRLVGLPGESIEIKDHQILIDGKPLTPPPGTPDLTLLNMFRGREFTDFFHYARPDNPTHLTASQYFVLGDNSSQSNDSRNTGPIPTANLIGVITTTYFPFNRFHIFR